MLKIFLNGRSVEVKENCNLTTALVEWGYALDAAFAAAVNHVFVPKQEYVNVFLQESDHVEIVAPMQGG